MPRPLLHPPYKQTYNSQITLLSCSKIRKMAAGGILIWVPLVAVVALFAASALRPVIASEPSIEREFVLTLDHSNFTDIVSKQDFIVVEFYAPWCGHCKKLAPHYEEAASMLSQHDPPLALAKVDAAAETNKALATEYGVRGFPTIKILRNGGKDSQDYKGPREAQGIAEYIKRQTGPPSTEIKSEADAADLTDNKIAIVGIFPEFSGEEFKTYISLAEKLRSDYDLHHTSDAKLLPRGDASVTGPVVRLFKPYDELVVDSNEFNVQALQKFVEISSVPLVIIMNNDNLYHRHIDTFFNGPKTKTKVLLFTNFSKEGFNSFKSKFYEVAQHYKAEPGMGFLFGDVDAGKRVFKYFGLEESQAPLIMIQTAADQKKYLKPNLEGGDDIAPWIQNFMDGKVEAYYRSQPIPEENNGPVKEVVGVSLQDMILNTPKNVLLKFYAPWCGHCKHLAPVMEEIAVHYEKDDQILIAKFDATVNDIQSDKMNVKGYPTVYFKTADGNISVYDGARTKQAIIDFIETSRSVKKSDASEKETRDEL